MNIYTVTIKKGGNGKTTTAAVLAQAAAHDAKRTLAVDMDAQGNLSAALAADLSPDRGNTFNLLEGIPAEQLIQTTPQGIDIIPACSDLDTLTSYTGSARRLAKALDPIRDKYDFIIIDTPTAGGELQYNALQAATRLIIPLQPDSYTLQSFYQTMDTAAQFAASNPALQVAGILLTRHRKTKFNNYMLDVLQDKAAAAGVPFLGTIREAIALREAAGLQVSLFDYAPANSNAVIDYLNVYNNIMEQEA